MEKIAVIEIKTTGVKLKIVEIVRNKFFEDCKTIEMPINLTKDFYNDLFVKTNVIKEINGILTVYKKIIEEHECCDVICLASDVVFEAKNQNGFINELSVTSGYKFRVMSPEDEITAIYTSVINSFNRPKGVIINISDFNTEVVLYNRRNILEKIVIPFGSVKLKDMYGNVDLAEKEKMVEKSVDEAIQNSNLMSQLPEEFDVIGTGDMFRAYGSICRKAKKYPIELPHNFVSNKEDMEKVYSLVTGPSVGSATKIKGVTLQDSKYLPSAMIIIRAIVNKFKNQEFVISNLDRVDGILFNEVLPITLEKPMSDTLGYSLQMLNDCYDKKPNNSQHIYELCMILFKQLKVLHKLPRQYVRVLRMAGYMSNAGYRVGVTNNERVVFDIIKNSNIFGVTHKEIILAAFVALSKNSDNFNLSEWVRYKEIMTDEDLIAVKKLSVILKVAEALDVTGFGYVNDISCDILGDSVIMKTIVDQEATFEINYTMLCGADFKKAFNKNLEVL